MKSKVFKSKVTLTIYHTADYPLKLLPLEVLVDDMNEGETVGSYNVVKQTEVEPENLEKELIAIGNDGTFFNE